MVEKEYYEGEIKNRLLFCNAGEKFFHYFILIPPDSLKLLKTVLKSCKSWFYV